MNRDRNRRQRAMIEEGKALAQEIASLRQEASPHPIARAGLDVGREVWRSLKMAPYVVFDETDEVYLGDEKWPDDLHDARQFMDFDSAHMAAEAEGGTALGVKAESYFVHEHPHLLSAVADHVLAQAARTAHPGWDSRLAALVQCLLENEPDELIADGGVTVLDQWRKDARSLFANLQGNLAGSADPYAHADGSRECRPAAGKWSRPDAEARAEEIARLFHDTYERLAPAFGYQTRPESAVHWDDVPETNKRLMIMVADVVAKALAPAERGAIVEECARLADRHAAPDGVPQIDYDQACHDIAAAIRQLKGGTHE